MIIESLTDDEVKDFVAIDFSETIREEQNFKKLLYCFTYFLTTNNEVEKYVQSNCSDHCEHQYNVTFQSICR